MKVCLLNDSFPPKIDGVANAVVNYASILTQNYDGAVVATPCDPDAREEYPFPVVRYPSLNTTERIGYRTGLPFSPETFCRIEQEHVGLLHSHCPAASTVLARMLRDLFDVPVIMTYHTKFDVDLANLIRSGAVRHTAIRLMIANISACDEVWVVSRGAGENLRSLGYEGEFVVMENGVDLPRERAASDEIDSVRKELALPKEIPVFLYVGRMMWYKGLRITLDALARLRDEKVDFRMVFVGDGADREEVERYCASLGLSQLCIFTGAIHDREKLRACYCAADLFLFPSTFDTNGLVVREAAACSLASVIVAGSCAAEGISDGETGLLISENPESMAKRLLWAAGHREECRALGERAAQRIYVSWEDSVAAAWKRYAVVCERYRSEEHKNRHPLTRELLRAAQEIGEARLRLHERHGSGLNDRYL